MKPPINQVQDISMMHLTQHYNGLIERIISQNKLASTIGLYPNSGLGQNLLLIYDQYFNGHKKYQERIERELFNYKELLSTCPVLSTFGNGISGLGVYFSFLNEQDLLYTDTEKFLMEVDFFVSQNAIELLENNDHDFIHAGIGNAIYLTLRTSFPNIREYLFKIIDVLKQIAITDNNGNIYWSEMKNGEEVINLSLSHGHASKIVLFSRILETGVKIPDVNLLLEKSVSFVLSVQNKNDNRSHFPNVLINGRGNEKSRLAWCYGDLGIGLSLWQAGEALQNETIKSEAVKIFNSTLTRVNYEDTLIVDAGICHGTVGIALIYNRIYKYTGDTKFRKSALYWCNETIQYLNENKSLKNYESKSIDNWYPDNGFLTGSSGIALALMSVISNKDYNWDRAFLLC